MEYFAGLDVAVEETSLCVIDQEGKVVLKTSVATDPVAIFKGLKNYAARLRRIGHEAGSLSPWLQVELKQRGLPAVCSRGLPHALCAVGDAQQDQQGGSARDRAHHAHRLVREGPRQERRELSVALLLTQRRNLKRKSLDLENAIRHSIKAFGLKVGNISRGEFEARVRELVVGDPLIASLTDCMLWARAATSCASASCAFQVWGR